jgi:aspartate aminotransferase-like enzyme
MEGEGRPAIFARHAACGAASRAGLAALGFELFADPAHASDTVTSAVLPEGVEWSALNRELRTRGLVLAGGQGKLKGRIFRIGHLGEVSVDDIASAIEVLEDGASALGLDVPRGVAAGAARAAAETAILEARALPAGA